MIKFFTILSLALIGLSISMFILIHNANMSQEDFINEACTENCLWK